jgi:hypothetical protein
VKNALLLLFSLCVALWQLIRPGKQHLEYITSPAPPPPSVSCCLSEVMTDEGRGFYTDSRSAQ